jgi:site-specific recombinase XerD
MLDPYLKFLREERQVTDKTIDTTRKMLCAFLDGLGRKVAPRDMKSLGVAAVEGYVRQHVKDSPHNLSRLVGSLRGFLQFCARQRYTASDFSGVIPSVPRYRLASLPRGIDDTCIDRMLKAISQDTPVGCRDYAIFMLLTAYGIRGQQVAELRLEDITWPRSLIRIKACKGGKEVVLPLLEAVGEAILRYLQHRPVNTPSRHLFLSSRAPHRPVTTMVISRMVREHIKKAGLEVPRYGTSTLRHSWAIRTLTQGSSIKAIADMLGHRWVHNTFIYAKADLKTLREVALSWPEVQP